MTWTKALELYTKVSLVKWVFASDANFMSRNAHGQFTRISTVPPTPINVTLKVYKAKLRADGREVAVKIQRPGLVQEVTKDLYVLKRAVGVYQRLSER